MFAQQKANSSTLKKGKTNKKYLVLLYICLQKKIKTPKQFIIAQQVLITVIVLRANAYMLKK